MDGDRPVVDGRDIFESKLQKLLREAWAIGCGDGYHDEWSDWREELYPKLRQQLERLESELCDFVQEVFEEGWEFGKDDLPNPYCGYAESSEAHAKHNERIHELLISYPDGPASDVGAQDETA